jgi:hypothetical protein
VALTLFTRWAGRKAFTDGHRFAACWGATLACQAMPYYTIASWPRIDITGKVFFDLAALALFAWLGTKGMRRRNSEVTAG